MADKAAAYEQGRARLTELILAAGPDAANRTVPACPDWTVKDLVAHLQNVAEDYAVGRHPYAMVDPTNPDRWREPSNAPATEDWADAGVAARRDCTLAQLLEDWETSTQRLCRMMTDAPVLADPQENDYLAWSALGDFAIHYQDMHGALGLPGDRDAYCAKLGFATLPTMFAAHAQTVAGLEPIRFVTARGDVVVGPESDGADVATVEVDWFELYRAISGRRSRAQVIALLAPLDPSPYIDAFTLYPFADEPLAV